MSLHFGYYHLDITQYIFSLSEKLAEDPWGAYKEGWLGWMIPEVLLALIEKARIDEIPPKFLVEMLHRKFEELVSAGHRFVPPSYLFDEMVANTTQQILPNKLPRKPSRSRIFPRSDWREWHFPH